MKTPRAKIGKRLVSLLLTAVMLVTIWQVPVQAETAEQQTRAQGTVYAGETDTEESLQLTPENETSVEAENSFGSLLADALQSEMDAQEGNNGYQIFSVKVEGTSVYVSFETLTSATILVGIYDESGIKLSNFGSAEVTLEDSGVFVNIETEKLPQYFYLRAFLIDTKTLRPLCGAYETPDYTKEMQDLFQSTVGDYAPDRVLNLDDNDTNNFAVYEDSTRIVIDDGQNNQLIEADDAAQSYIFECADEELTSLKAGDILAYRSGGEDLIVKIGTIHIDGASVTIRGTDTSMEEVFANVKIDTQQSTSEVDMSQAVCGDGVTYLGRIGEDKRSVGAGNSSRKVEIGESVKLESKYKFEKKDKTGTINLSGTADAGMGISVKAYITLHHQKIDFTVNESLHMDLTAKVNLKEEIELFTVPFSPIPAIHINVSLVIPVEVNAKITVALDMTAQQGFSYDTDAGFQSLTKSPEIDVSVEIEGKLYVGLRLGITGDVLDEELLSLSLYGEIGEEFSASNAKKDASDSVKHDCLLCLDGDITLKAGLYAKLNIIKILENKEFKLMETSCKQGDFYYCMDRNEFGFGDCPYQRFKVAFTVLDNWDFTELEGAKVNKENVADKSGITVCYLPSGNYKFPVEMNGYQTQYLEFSVEGKSKKQMVYLKKDGNQQNPDNPDDGKEYMKAYYEILDMFYYKIGAGWGEDITEDVSYLWQWGYGPQTLSEAGYCFKDLDGNGVPELLLSSPAEGTFGNGMFWDLYTYIDGKVIHLAKSGERYRYYLCGDNTINYESSGGASLSSSAIYHLDSKRKSLVLDEVVKYDNGTWYYGTEECSDSYYGYNENKMTIITPEKAIEIENRFTDKTVSLDLTLLDTYTPKGTSEKPDDFALKKAYREAVCSEKSLYFRADDYDKNGTREAFGITGNYDRNGNAEGLKVYFIDSNNRITCIDEIEKLLYANTKFQEGGEYLILDTGHAKFLKLGDGECLMDTLYGVKGNSSYQPEISGKYTSFQQNWNGMYYGCGYEEPDYRYGYEYNSSTGEFDFIDKEWVGDEVPQSNDVNVKTIFREGAGENMSVSAPTITENPDGTAKTAVFTNLMPYEQYNFYVMLSDEGDNRFSRDNLFYVRQGTADSQGRLSVEYAAEHIPNDAKTFVVGRTRTDISGAQISIPKLTYNGKEQYVQPVVTLGDKRLIEGTDYELSGTYSAVEAGSYKVAISGIGMYTGVVYADYQIAKAEKQPETTITYNANGGKNAPAAQKKTSGKTLTLSKTKPTRTGYTFQGWATNKTATTATYKAGDSFKTDKNITLYAVWKANTYKIAFNKNGGSGSLSKVSCTYGKSATLPANKFTRSGYKFLGWNTKKNGSGTSYANKVGVKNLTSTNGKTVTLYAQWGKGVTVTYNANSGKVSKKSKKVYHKSAYGTLATPTKKRYTFAGWYTKKSGGSKITSKTKVSKKSNHTLYAHWTKTKYKITYYLNGGKNNVKNPSGYYETTATITLKNPTKTGYTFKGWYSDSKFKKKVTKIKKGSTGARKFYAKWAANTYTVRYNSNGGTGSMADTTSMKYGTSYKLRTNTFKRSGYVFAGWATSSDGKVVYTDGVSVKNLVSSNGAVKTLYAKWNPIAVEKLSLNVVSVSINVGETYKLQAAISPAEATDNLVWSSSNTAVATVSNGVVTGETAGMTTITVKSSNGKTASCIVTVKTPEVLPSGVTLSEQTATIDVGKTVSLTATVAPGNATNKSVTWTSNNTSVATVSDGTVAGKSAGTATITVTTSNGKTASCTVTVNTPEVLPSGITLSERTARIDVGENVSLAATITPSNATNKTVTWSSNNINVATVSGGTVTGKSAGTATITASTNNGKTATCTVTVTESVVVAESVSLNKYSLNLEKGETEQLQAVIEPSNVTDNFVVWSSADMSVATVDQNGTVKGVNDGKVTITVSTANGKKTTCSVTVYTSVQIRTVAELKAIENDLDGNYKLAANIDLGKSEWIPIGKDKNTPFTGKLNGNGYQITGLSITDNSQVYSGLFGYCKGTVTNLTVSGTVSTDGSNGDSYRYAGGIAGFAEKATIEKCTNLVEITVSNKNEAIGTYTYAGGIVGAADSSTNIFECKNEADIIAVSPKGTRADAMAGGIVGAAFNGGKIQDCENTGIISSNASNGTKYWVSSCAGGIAGAAGLSKITDCINRGNVFAEGSISISSDYDSMVLAGGIAGNSNKSGNVSGENFADKIQATGNELIATIQQDPLVAFSIN